MKTELFLKPDDLLKRTGKLFKKFRRSNFKRRRAMPALLDSKLESLKTKDYNEWETALEICSVIRADLGDEHFQLTELEKMEAKNENQQRH